jgi:diguanylate cyclase (GGDEF)-like protein
VSSQGVPDAFNSVPPSRPQDRAMLDALVRLATLITASPGTADLMETVAETARELLNADSVSISMREDDGTTLRTLINVGSLGPGEQRWPLNETYQVADFPDTLGFLLHQPVGHVATAVDDPRAEPAEVALLRSLGKSSSLKTPIILDAHVWGELWASRGSGAPAFTEHDADVGQVIVGLVSAGIAQAAAWTAMRRMASTDPLTGLANRRALDEHLRSQLDVTRASGHVLTVAVGDVNGLKLVNDSAGHAAGDDALLRVAAAATQAISEIPDALAARFGGDEFALVLPRLTTAEAEVVGTQWCRGSADTRYGTSLACGLASTANAGSTEPPHLLNAADEAQVRAKRTRSTTPVWWR